MESIISETEYTKSELKPPDYFTPFSDNYSAGGIFTLVDGKTGSLNYNDGRWQGFEESNFEVVIDQGKMKEINQISIRFLQSIDFWILNMVIAHEFNPIDDSKRSRVGFKSIFGFLNFFNKISHQIIRIFLFV